MTRTTEDEALEQGLRALFELTATDPTPEERARIAARASEVTAESARRRTLLVFVGGPTLAAAALAVLYVGMAPGSGPGTGAGRVETGAVTGAPSARDVRAALGGAGPYRAVAAPPGSARSAGVTGEDTDEDLEEDDLLASALGVPGSDETGLGLGGLMGDEDGP